MKKLVLGSLITIAATSSVFAECTYNFDANQTQLTAISPGAVPFPNITGQKVSLTLGSGSKRYLAASSNFGNNKINQPNKTTGDIALHQNNIIAYEMIVKAPNTILSNASVVELFPVAFYGTKSGDNVLSNFIASLNNLSTLPDQILSAWQSIELPSGNIIGANMIDNNDLNNGVRVGYYINQNTKQLGVIANGINYGYVGGYSVKPDEGYFVAQVFAQNIPSNSNIIGKEFSIELITDSSKMQFTYPTGTKDICGNVI